MANMIVSLFGSKRSGKDSLADHLVNSFEYTKFHFADNLRTIMAATGFYVDDQGTRLNDLLNTIGWEAAKEQYPEVRRVMKFLGTNGCRRTLGEEVWVEALDKQIDSTHGNVVISDGRFINESRYTRRKSGLVVKVERKWKVAPEYDGHESETEVEQIVPHMTIHNDQDLANLRDKATEVHRALIQLESTLEW